jgi:type IV secretion system protein VirB6
MDQGGWNNLLAYLYGAIVFICVLALTGYTLFLLVLSKIAVGVMLGLAPFFIILYLFGHTKGIFEGWLRQLITYSLVPIIVYALYAMILVITLQPMNALFTAASAGVPTVTQIAPFLIVNFIALILLQQVLAWAGSIGGGLQLNTAGAAQGAYDKVKAFSGRRARIIKKNFKNLKKRADPRKS